MSNLRSELITDPEEKRILSVKIKTLENTLGITGKELARRCNMSDATIYRLEGTTSISTAITKKTIRKICEKTGADASWMFDGNELSPIPAIPVTNEKTDETPADRIRLLRAELGISQGKFARKIGTSHSNFAAIERGETRLTELMAKKIESQFPDGGAEWLLTGNERNRHYPIGDDMIEWLKNHENIRKTIWIEMMRESNATLDS
jgi:transcriptional regulator with XRE-family HTH domain